MDRHCGNCAKKEWCKDNKGEGGWAYCHRWAGTVDKWKVLVQITREIDLEVDLDLDNIVETKDDIIKWVKSTEGIQELTRHFIGTIHQDRDSIGLPQKLNCVGYVATGYPINAEMEILEVESFKQEPNEKYLEQERNKSKLQTKEG
jgi:hypothetical protein